MAQAAMKADGNARLVTGAKRVRELLPGDTGRRRKLEVKGVPKELVAYPVRV